MLMVIMIKTDYIACRIDNKKKSNHSLLDSTLQILQVEGSLTLAWP